MPRFRSNNITSYFMQSKLLVNNFIVNSSVVILNGFLSSVQPLHNRPKDGTVLQPSFSLSQQNSLLTSQFSLHQQQCGKTSSNNCKHFLNLVSAKEKYFPYFQRNLYVRYKKFTGSRDEEIKCYKNGQWVLPICVPWHFAIHWQPALQLEYRHWPLRASVSVHLSS